MDDSRELERLCRELYREYESLRDVKKATDIGRNAWLLSEQLKVIEPKTLSDRLDEAIHGIDRAIRGRSDQEALTRYIDTLSKYTFVAAVNRRLPYDSLRPHENIAEGYRTGYSAGLLPEISFSRLAHIDDPTISELFHFLGGVYRGVGIDPETYMSGQLKEVRELRRKD
jgi:hypothetical protein